MSKQTFKIGKSVFPNILVLSCSAMLLLFGALLVVSPTEVATKALVNTTEYEDGLSIATNVTLDTNIHPEDGGTIAIAKDTVVGNTSSPYGYELYVSANSETINDIYLNGNTTLTENTKKISATTGTYDTPAALDITNGATWGYAIAGLDNFDASYNIYAPAASAKFAAMPVIENKQLIHEVTTAATDDATEIYYGIKADSTLEPGLYKTEILYTAVPKQAPRVAKAILGDNGNLNFVYDNLTYTVGDTYTDNLGQPTEITNVYTVPMGSSAQNDTPWHADYATYSSIASANFDASFHDFKPITTAYWFSDCGHLASVTNLENLDTSETLSLAYMFGGIGSDSSITAVDFGNVKSLDVSHATTLHAMFAGAALYATTINIDLENWDLSSAYDIGNMFDDFGMYAHELTLNLKNWNVPNVATIYHTFWNTGYMYNVATEIDTFVHIDVSGWQLGNLRTAESAFWYTGGYADEIIIEGLEDWDVSTLSVAKEMFMCIGMSTEIEDFYFELKNWDLSSITDTSYMFYEMGAGATGDWEMDLSGWTFKGGFGSAHMFDDAGYRATNWTLNASGWTFGDNTALSMTFNDTGTQFNYAETWTIDVTDWTFGSSTVMYQTFYNAGSTAATWTMIGASTWNVENVTTFVQTFHSAGSSSTSWSIGDLSGWDTSNVTNMSYMFGSAGQRAGTNFYIGDISGWDVSNVAYHDSFIMEASDNPHGVVEPNWP